MREKSKNSDVPFRAVVPSYPITPAGATHEEPLFRTNNGTGDKKILELGHVLSATYDLQVCRGTDVMHIDIECGTQNSCSGP
jgi:hypothetical protein